MSAFRRPNILIIYTDQQRRDTLGCYGQTAVPTPNIDALAASGTIFDSMYVQSPVCGPSRACFLTGRYCSGLHIGTNGIKVPADVYALPRLLSPYGYHTAQFGKLHFDPHARRDHRDPTDTYGFDTLVLSDEPGCYDDAYTRWVETVAPEQLDGVRTMLPPAALSWGHPSYSDTPRNTHEPYLFGADADLTHTAFVTEQVCSYIESRTPSEPFMAIAGYYAPHPPLNPPEEYVQRVDTSRITLPRLGRNERFNGELASVTPEKWIQIRAYYLAMVAQIDDGVGRIVETLRAQGLYENTVIVFTSDHGEYLGDHGRIQKWMPGHRCITNVPFIISCPMLEQAVKRTSRIAEAIDVLPTILDLCAVQTPSFVQGASLLPLIKGETDAHRDSALTELFDGHGERQTCVRTERYMYYLHENGSELLYDLEADPYELEDVKDDPAHAEALAFMRFEMLRRVQKAAYRGLPRSAEY